MWFILALLSAVFAGAVSVLVKPGLGTDATKISPNLATAIRMLVVLPLACKDGVPLQMAVAVKVMTRLLADRFAGAV